MNPHQLFKTKSEPLVCKYEASAEEKEKKNRSSRVHLTLAKAHEALLPPKVNVHFFGANSNVNSLIQKTNLV